MAESCWCVRDGDNRGCGVTRANEKWFTKARGHEGYTLFFSFFFF